MKTEKELFKETLINMGYHESAFSFDSQTEMYALEMTQENWRIWQASASREGYKLVPVEPTTDMWWEGKEELQNNGDATDIYKAMIGAVE